MNQQQKDFAHLVFLHGNHIDLVDWRAQNNLRVTQGFSQKDVEDVLFGGVTGGANVQTIITIAKTVCAAAGTVCPAINNM